MVILFLGGILRSVKEVWHYVASGVRSAVTREQVVEVVTPISDALSKEDVSQSYGLYEEAVAGWQRINNIDVNATVSDEFAVNSPFDWRQNHIMNMRIQGRDIKSGEEVDRWITVESDKNLTLGEWETLGGNAVSDSIMGYDIEIDYVIEYEYYQKVSKPL